MEVKDAQVTQQGSCSCYCGLSWKTLNFGLITNNSWNHNSFFWIAKLIICGAWEPIRTLDAQNFAVGWEGQGRQCHGETAVAGKTKNFWKTSWEFLQLHHYPCYQEGFGGSTNWWNYLGNISRDLLTMSWAHRGTLWMGSALHLPLANLLVTGRMGGLDEIFE